MPALVLLGVAILIGAVHIPLILGKVPPNRFYGFRTPRLIADERAWYPANRIAGRNGLILSAGMLGFAAMMTAGYTPWWLAVVMPIFVIGNLLATFIAASRIVADLDRGGPRLDLSRKDFSGRSAVPSREKLLDKLTRKE